MKNDLDTVAIIGIRREDKNVWERRTPLTPEDCSKLIKKTGLKILVQPSKIRCFTDEEYKNAGCEVEEDLSSANLIICVKEVPKHLLIEKKTYIFFSHTTKGQESNIPMLQEILEKKIRLFDYECIKDQQGLNKASSRYAGIVGAIDFIQGIGRFFLHKDLYTPFLHSSYSYMHNTYEDAKESIKKVGKLIKERGIPQELCPLVFGITSYGAASQGVQEILNLLPNQRIECDDLKSLFENCKKNPAEVKTDKIYIVVFSQKDMYRKKNDKSCGFDKLDLYQHPENYKSIFAENCLPYVTVLFNCLYWDYKFPRLISLEDSKRFTQQNKLRLQGVCDITCDIRGSIELMQKHTSIDNPFYIIDPSSFQIRDTFDDINTKSILYNAVDHMPCELPIDSSVYFSSRLFPYIPLLASSSYPSKYNESQKDLPNFLFDACITWNGMLTPKYSYLDKYLTNLGKWKDIDNNKLPSIKDNKNLS